MRAKSLAQAASSAAARTVSRCTRYLPRRGRGAEPAPAAAGRGGAGRRRALRDANKDGVLCAFEAQGLKGTELVVLSLSGTAKGVAVLIIERPCSTGARQAPFRSGRQRTTCW
jgi:hypothetical protein